MNEKGIDVLEKYDLDIIRTCRVRGAILCETRKGCFLLKEYAGTEARLIKIQEVLSALRENSSVAVDKVIKNKEDQWITQDCEHSPYIVKEWNCGRECNLSDENDILRAVRLMAQLHESLRHIDGEGILSAPSVLQELNKHTMELRRARTYVRRVHHKSDFELCMMEMFPPLYKQAEEAVQLCKEYSECYLCHGEFSHHHVLYDGNFSMVTDFVGMMRDVQASDLYYFMRKTLEKRNFHTGLGERMVQEYDQILPLSRMEREYLYLRFLYPEKYWKQVNYYLNSNKAWIPARNTEKLKILGRQEEERKKFLDILRRAVI